MRLSAQQIVNLITLYRVVAAPFLIFLLTMERFDVFRWMLVLSFCTDAIDGWLARRLHATSIFGAKLDSIGDDLTVFAGIVGLIVYRPAFVKDQLILIIILITLFLVQSIAALIRYRRTTSFHTYLAKLAALFQGTFLILCFFLVEPLHFLFYATVFITALELIEEIAIITMLPTWQTNVKGIYWIIGKKHRSRKSG
jgi:phosphatidylglycerophosphate synthase